MCKRSTCLICKFASSNFWSVLHREWLRLHTVKGRICLHRLGGLNNLGTPLLAVEGGWLEPSPTLAGQGVDRCYGLKALYNQTLCPASPLCCYPGPPPLASTPQHFWFAFTSWYWLLLSIETQSQISKQRVNRVLFTYWCTYCLACPVEHTHRNIYYL